MEPINFEKELPAFKRKFKSGMGRELKITDFLSYKLYPKVFVDAYNKHIKYGNVMSIPTKNFFFGMDVGEEIIIELDQGKNVLVSMVLKGEPDDNGNVNIQFKVNGQGRNVLVKDNSIAVEKKENVKIDSANAKHVGSPLQGLLSNLLVKKGQKVKRTNLCLSSKL